MYSLKSSLVISTYNWPAALELCLKSVLLQTKMPNEIIIADDGSGDETRQLVNDYKKLSPVPILHVWHTDEGFQKTIILNKAIKQSTAPYIVQIDGDVILEKHFIADHLRSAQPKAFIRGTRAMLTPQKTQELLNNKSINISVFTAGLKHRNNALRLYALRFLGARTKMSSNSVRGSNMSFWKEDFININGYDNSIKGWGHEDEELAARFINIGVIKKIVKLCAVQYHLYHPVSGKSNEPKQRELVEQVKHDKIKQTPNGYRQII
ncbi:glycosyltransferase involved in cell wall biosynthesis [Mucilaginibacter sp. UYP25]|uniref:glycosyltransferase family 2 protein n=1 Tax=unclassified Mucilaginibacter TaxID=2617802 RepID=UPI0033985282